MPQGKRGGSEPGKRRGGRKPGVPNKATIEKAMIAEQVMARAKMTGQPLAKEVLDKFMQLFAGIAAAYQPYPPGQPPNPRENQAKFEKYARYAVETASRLAPYQSPTFRAVTIGPPPPPEQEPGHVLRAMLEEIDGEARVERAHVKQIEHMPAEPLKRNAGG